MLLLKLPFIRFCTLIICLCFTTLLSAQSGYKITVKTDVDTVGQAFLSYYVAGNKLIRDTATVNDGQFVFAGDEPLKRGLYSVLVPPEMNSFELFVDEDQTMNFETAKEDFVGHMKVEGSEANELYYNYLKESSELNREIKSLQESGSADQAKINKLNNEVNKLRSDFVNTHPDHYFTKMNKGMEEPEIPEGLTKEENLYYYKQHFFDHFDLSDESMFYSPIYRLKVDTYLNRLTHQTPDSLIQSVDYIISESSKHEDAYQWNVIHLLNKYSQAAFIGMNDVYVHIIDNYYLNGKAPWVEEQTLAQLRVRANALRPTILGSPAPLIQGKDLDGNTHNISELEGSYVIIYFWSYDCGNCKLTTPDVLDMAITFDDEPVKLLTVSRHELTEEWKNAVQEAQLIRPNIHNWDAINVEEITANYDINAVPMLYLLDKDLTILSKRISGAQARKILAEQLREDATN